jgi:hypothetical protein
VVTAIDDITADTATETMTTVAIASAAVSAMTVDPIG